MGLLEAFRRAGKVWERKPKTAGMNGGESALWWGCVILGAVFIISAFGDDDIRILPAIGGAAFWLVAVAVAINHNVKR